VQDLFRHLRIHCKKKAKNIMDMEKLKEEIKADEGVIYEVYNDHLGYKTCGVGHLCRATDPENQLEVGDPVSVERVDELFEKDLHITIEECRKLYEFFDDLPEDAKRIIANMMFNLGRPRLTKFRKMYEAVMDANWIEAAIQMEDSLWAKQVPNRAERLCYRMRNVA
jgi:lysozyme|tara:strand:+ start:2579 stop:3079 length:501 start_codon:yes stop_codon:yes gene_type:complete